MELTIIAGGMTWGVVGGLTSRETGTLEKAAEDGIQC
jgi:hypothetical protein